MKKSAGVAFCTRVAQPIFDQICGYTRYWQDQIEMCSSFWSKTDFFKFQLVFLECARQLFASKCTGYNIIIMLLAVSKYHMYAVWEINCSWKRRFLSIQMRRIADDESMIWDCRHRIDNVANQIIFNVQIWSCSIKYVTLMHYKLLKNELSSENNSNERYELMFHL